MAKRKQIVDVYPNRMVERITMSAANVESFKAIRFGTGLFSGVALIIHRLEYFISSVSLSDMTAIADEILFGMTNRDDLSSLRPQNLNILDTNILHTEFVGAVVSQWWHLSPIIKDFSTLPGGGLIIPTTPLYLAMDTVGLANGGQMDVILYYTFKQMSDADYIELVQGMLPANI